MLCGKDGVDAWTNQPIWDAALKGIDIVVATHAVLADALTHAFVRMTNICLLVFDEAHHAANNHPAARVMTFYHPMSDDVERKRPKVLGLTASPVVRKRDSAGLKVLETNLDATVCTPKVHREQLLLHAHRPEMSVASYGGATPLTCPLMHDLEALYNAMDIEQDPYVMRVKEEDPAAYTKAITKRKTYCQDTVKSLCNKSKEVMKDLGPRLCHVYIQTVLQKLMKPRKSDTLYGPSFDQEEEAYLQRLLTPLTTHWSKSDDLDHSPKVYRLLDLLSQHMNHDTRAIIFVKTRAGVFLMKHLLDAHAGLLQCRVGTFVGQSEFSGRGNAIELLDPRYACTSALSHKNVQAKFPVQRFRNQQRPD